MRDININKEKIINSMLFILNNLGGKSDFHKIFKILYFADQKHLITYGFLITGDFYIAMQNGPVPSKLYDVLKAIRGDSFWSSTLPHSYEDLFEVESHYVTAKKEADIDELAESDVECLLESISENQSLNFRQLKDKSHQLAWENARNDENNFDNVIDIIDIAKEAKVNEEILKYVLLNLENKQVSKIYA